MMKALDRLKLLSLFWWLPFGRVAEISAFELSRRLGAEPRPQIIDVRTRWEWRRSHIEGAVSVPIHELKDRIPSLDLDPARPIIIICRSGHRSIPAVRLLRSRGFEQSAQLQGGILAWRRERFPTFSERGAD